MARCSCVLTGEGVSGVLSLSQSSEDAPTVMEGSIDGLKPGLHGLHVHIFGDFSQGLTSAGGYFNPFGKNHGSPDADDRMVGAVPKL